MQRQYCYMCGNKTVAKDLRVYWCEQCQQDYYDNPRPCADLYLFDDNNKLLIARRKFEPGKGKLDIPGGFAEFGERLDETARREIQEELNLGEDDYSPPVYFTSYYADYPWGSEVYQTITAVYVARLRPHAAPEAMDDVENIMFVDPHDLRRDEFGFPPQADNALGALKKLQEEGR